MKLRDGGRLACIFTLLTWHLMCISYFSYTRSTWLSDQTYESTTIAPNIENATMNVDFGVGSLNVAPTLHRQCITVRFRGDDHNYTIQDAMAVLTRKYRESPGPRQLRMGIMIMEDVQRFFPVRVRPSGNQYHMFHFMELLVMTYAELHRLASTLPMHAGYDSTRTSSKTSSTNPTSLAKGSPSISVPWIFSPYMTPSEVCGGPSEINCLIADIVLRGSNHSIFQSHSGVIGLEGMENYTFNYDKPKEKAVPYRMQLASHVYGESPYFANQADGVIIVERIGCPSGGINKPWSGHIDAFPAYSWHSDVLHALGRTWFSSANPNSPSNTRKLVVGYIDRQNTDRNLPDEHHKWIVQYCESHPSIEFRQLHMEDYTPLGQVETASECDMLIGMHGNGLTHSLWMPPNRYVIELFWNFKYQFDYSTTAQLLNHTHLGIWNGKVVDPDRELKREPALRDSMKDHKPTNESMADFEREGRVAIQEYIDRAIRELDL
jgi:Glycosyltransferase 61